MNELLWLCFALFDMGITVLMHRLFGAAGLHGLIVLNLMVCNIQVLKTVTLFGMTTTLGNIVYAGVFLATDMLGEFHGKAEARKGVLLGFITLLLGTAYMQASLLYAPAPSDFAQPHLEALFGLLPRLAGASLLAYLVSQYHDVWAYHFWMQRTGGRHLWLRNNASTLVSQVLDSSVFCLAAFTGVYPFEVVLEIMLTTYLFKAVVALLDTPFIYLARRLHRARPADPHAAAATAAG